jgi:hypothetical protein
MRSPGLIKIHIMMRVKSVFDVNGKKGSSEKSDRDGEYVGLVNVGLVKAVGEVNEESVQTTAPDVKVFDDGAVNENGGRIFSPKSIHADQNVDRFYMGSRGTVAAGDMKDISTVLSSTVEESRLDKNAYKLSSCQASCHDSCESSYWKKEAN